MAYEGSEPWSTGGGMMAELSHVSQSRETGNLSIYPAKEEVTVNGNGG